MHYYRWILCFLWGWLLMMPSSVSSFPAVMWHPSRVALKEASQSYPDSIWRKFTSSVPRREFAIENLSLTLESEVLMLLGASSSGKSTILRLVLGSEEPVSGSVRMSTTDPSVPAARPILLDERPVYSNQQRTVESIWTDSIESPLAKSYELAGELLHELSHLFALPLDQKASELSPSETYRCRLAEACLQSMLHPQQSKSFDNETLVVPAPILLLDEWMDTETSTVVQNVQPSLQQLANRGAVVVCVTHKPQLYKTDDYEQRMRRITLSRGTILSMTQ
jgi:ABC-type multidrug transport system ATPase subunit